MEADEQGECHSADRATLFATRRSFLAGSKLVAGAGLALAAGVFTQTRPAKADRNDRRDYRDTHEECDDPHCFLRGTRILTPNGNVEIERLSIGDPVLTAKGEVKSVKWIGRQVVERASNPGAAPVKICRFAIDGKAPEGDLYVSPAHALYIDGILIPAGNLVNGVTIIANAKPEISTITYYHVELDSHEVILAEGLAVESFFGGNRKAFDNAGDYERLYGSVETALTPCAPIMSYHGGRQELASHVRSVLAPLYDFRKPIDKVRD